MHRILIIGTGSIGERHLRCFLHTGRARVSFVELRPELRDQIAARYPNASAYASLDEALAGPVDAAVIATPAPLHVPQALQLVQRGISVLVEKPLAVGLEGCDELIQQTRTRPVVAAVAYVHRANPLIEQMRRAVLDGQFGEPVELISVSGQNFPFFRPAYRQTYYVKHESGGGAVQDALTHSLNLGEWIVGPMSRVVADTAHKVLDGVDVEDTAHVLARHGDVMASYSLNQHQAPNEMTLTIVCQRGTVRYESQHYRWRAMANPGDEWVDHSAAPFERDELFIRQANSFLDTIEGKRAPLCSLAEGLQTLRANIAILASAQARTWQEISHEQ